MSFSPLSFHFLVSFTSSASGEQVDEKAPSAGAKSLAFPFDQEKYPKIEHGKTKCPACGSDAKRWMLFGRSY
jgi:prolyl-tRNA synthetase